MGSLYHRGPTGLFPAGYNNGYEIVQTPTYVVVLAEMIHRRASSRSTDARIPADREIVDGDSRGRWKATPVVDTPTSTRAGWMRRHVGSGRLRGVPHTEQPPSG